MSGIKEGNLIWPVIVKPWIKKINIKNWNIVWTINLKYLNIQEIKTNYKFNDLNLKEDWFEKFNSKKIYIKDLVTNINYSPNFIKIKALNLLTDELMNSSVITFKEY